MRNRSRAGQLHGLLASYLGVALVFHPVFAAIAIANPEGASVVQGDVAFGGSGAYTSIHASDGSIIDYSSFNIQSFETVEFIQPSAMARVLNRINSARPTQIDGSLLANGQVYIENPAGVYFGNGAVVDVNRLVVSAGAISNEDFTAGVDHFTDVTGRIENRGVITGEIVTLVGRFVANHGWISAPGGFITLVAGDEVYLKDPEGRGFVKLASADLGSYENPGVENTGVLDAEGGAVSMAAGDFYSHPFTEVELDCAVAGRMAGIFREL